MVSLTRLTHNTSYAYTWKRLWEKTLHVFTRRVEELDTLNFAHMKHTQASQQLSKLHLSQIVLNMSMDFRLRLQTSLNERS